MAFETESTVLGGEERLAMAIPVIKSIQATFFDETWKIYFPDELSEVLLPEEKLEARIYQELHEQVKICGGMDSRRQIDIVGIPLAVVILNDKKEVRLYSANMSNELFIVQELTKIRSVLMDQPEFEALALHLEAGASLDVARFPTIIEELTVRLNDL